MANSAVVHLREPDTSCAPGIIPRDSFRSLPSFSRRYSFADPCGGQAMYHERHRPLSPRFSYHIFIGRSSAAPGDIKHDRPIALHIAIAELHRFRQSITSMALIVLLKVEFKV